MISGLRREVWSPVPPLRSIVRVLARVNSTTQSELSAAGSGRMLSRAAQPRRSPMTSQPASSMRATKPLITMLRPGTSPPPVRIAIRLLTLLSAHFHQAVDEIDDAVRVSPLVVVPGDHLGEAVAGRQGRERVEDRGMWVADDVGGHQRPLAVLDDAGAGPPPLHRPPPRAPPP